MKQIRWIVFGAVFFLLLGCTEKKSNQTIPYDPKLIANVKDLSAPTILCESEYSIMINEEFDIKQKFSVTDNTDDNPKISISGNYDIKKIGNYTITIIAKDTDGNSSNKKVLLVVKDKEVPKSQTNNEDLAIQNNGETKQPQPIPPSPLKTPITPNATEKDFMFKEGQSSMDSYNECMTYGKNVVNAAQANSVSCEVISNNGIFIGYHSYFR